MAGKDKDFGKKVAFFTLGCKLNFAETSSLAQKFKAKGYVRCSKIEACNFVVINTCSVTSLAEKKGRSLISKTKRLNKNARIIVIGCYAQLRPDELKKMGKIDLILGNHEKFQIFDYLKKEHNEIIFRRSFKTINHTEAVWSSTDRTRTFLKVQDGCSYFCAYCTIPMARGLSRSPNIETILQSVKQIIKSGTKEIVLTGVNIGDFGKQHGETFEQLLTELCKTPNLPRIRLGSIEPNLLSNNIIKIVAQHNSILPHFHIPLQCGTDEMLQKMNRRYTTELFKSRVKTIKKMIPNALIAADVIVGVPGETDKHHKSALKFIEELQISYLHVFTYSERPDTNAAKMPEQVDKYIRNLRSKEMHNLSNNLKKRFLLQQLGKTQSALFEKKEKNGFIYGYTDNYIQIKTPYQKKLANRIIQVKLIEIDNNGTINVEV